jgi:hypothetical protein
MTKETQSVPSLRAESMARTIIDDVLHFAGNCRDRDATAKAIEEFVRSERRAERERCMAIALGHATNSGDSIAAGIAKLEDEP